MRIAVLFLCLFFWDISLGKYPGETLENPHLPSSLFKNNFLNLLNTDLNDYREHFMAKVLGDAHKFYSKDNKECYDRISGAGLNRYLFQIKVRETVSDDQTHVVSDMDFLGCGAESLFKIQIVYDFDKIKMRNKPHTYLFEEICSCKYRGIAFK